MKIKTKQYSQRNRALSFMRDFSYLWFTAREVVKNSLITMTDATMGRRLREDFRKGILARRVHKDGYVMYRFKRGTL